MIPLALRAVAATTFAVCVLASLPARAREPYTLAELQAKARQSDLRVKEADAELARLLALQQEANWAWFPQFETTALFGGPTPEARNDGLGGPPLTAPTRMYDANLGRAGVTMGVEANAFLPLFTFGKLNALARAGEKGVDVGHGLRLRAQDQAAYDAAQAFYGYQLAREAKATIDETMTRLNDAEQLIKELLAQESPQVTQVDLYKLGYFRMQLQARMGQVDAGRDLAMTAVRLLTAATPGEDVQVVEQDLEDPKFTLQPVAHYEQVATSERPELRAIAAGIGARQEAVLIHERLFYPDLGLAGFFRWRWTTSATRQYSPFAYDPYNDLSGGVALVARATFDIPQKDAKLDQARAELAKLEAQRGQLEAGISLEVHRAHGHLSDALTRARALTEAERNARRWAMASFASFELGTADTRELTDAFTALAAASAEKIKAWHDANLGIEELSRVVGSDLRAAPVPGERAP